jgi:hypothetical protein
MDGNLECHRLIALTVGAAVADQAYGGPVAQWRVAITRAGTPASIVPDTSAGISQDGSEVHRQPCATVRERR